MWRYAIVIALLPLAMGASWAVTSKGDSASLRLGVADASNTMHFKLLGPDWARVPKGPGVLPEKEVAELNIPKEYVPLHSSFPLFRPPTESESSIGIDIFYPSMKGATGGQSSETHIYVAIHAHRGEETSRNGVAFLLSRDGMMRDSPLDVGGLCGYVDNQHPGTAGQEFYSSCEEAERTFFIACFPPFNDRRSCSETAFLAGQIGGELTYQYPILKEHRAMLDALRKLVMSFVQPTSGSN